MNLQDYSFISTIAMGVCAVLIILGIILAFLIIYYRDSRIEKIMAKIVVSDEKGDKQYPANNQYNYIYYHLINPVFFASLPLATAALLLINLGYSASITSLFSRGEFALIAFGLVMPGISNMYVPSMLKPFIKTSLVILGLFVCFGNFVIYLLITDTSSDMSVLESANLTIISYMGSVSYYFISLLLTERNRGIRH
jgi:hypothetical protein